MTQAKIPPTVGRVLWFFDKKRHPGFHENPNGGPYAAQIASVCSDDVVNLTVSDAHGTTHGRVGVILSHAGGQPEGADYWCEWMPYQKGQAAKTEAVERSLGHLSRHLGLVPLPVVDPGIMVREIQAQASNSRRVTPADVEAEITHEFYFTPARAMEGDDALEVWRFAEKGPGEEPLPAALTSLTFCVLVLRNGTKVVGINHGAIDPAQHSVQRGREEARKQAIDKMYELLGFRLRDHLHERALYESAPRTGAPAGVCRTTFDELVRHGLAECLAEHRDDSIVNGMPWSFTYKGMPVSHENDDCYIVAGVRFERGQVLLTEPGHPPRVLPAEGSA